MMKQMTAMVAKPVCLLTEKVRASNMTPVTARSVLHVYEERYHDDRHQRDRKRRTERPVPSLSELQLDQIAEHHVLAAAEDPRRDIGAEGGNEGENGAGDEAGLDERNDDPAQDLKTGGVEVVARLD